MNLDKYEILSFGKELKNWPNNLDKCEKKFPWSSEFPHAPSPNFQGR